MLHHRTAVTERPVTIILRDQHNRRQQIQYRTADRAAIAIRNGDITDDDTILLVHEGDTCVYSKLMSRVTIKPADLIDFLKWET